ncbi:IclR family transcriptional regulator [Microbacterium sp. 8M]|jgi:DNA-binding IclR family transcriptional regulator|uniref:IclR family transcriptional regulator n=1 Tax=Microbacterium sp. 8M TaxID=2653153 RepID=UPI0012F31E62|nr:IclR family transcriptional regulator [Microbacterium sp. 8M]VXB49969.1 IclR family transcriptional regulator [Microbacterium sp. 8M]
MPTAEDSLTRSSMGRGFDVLSALADLMVASPGGASVQEVAHALGRERSQISRTLSALADQRLVERGDDHRYRLAWGWYAAAQDLTDRRLRSAGVGVLDELAARTGEACFLGVLQGDSTLTIVESIPDGSRMIGSWIGRAYPAFCSDGGQAVLWDATDDEVRAVLAQTRFTSPGPNAPASVDDFLDRLHRARERGYAIVDQEAEPELYSVSAPVWDFRGEVAAAVQIVGERTALQPRTDALAQACVAAAEALSAALGAPAAGRGTRDVSDADRRERDVSDAGRGANAAH